MEIYNKINNPSCPPPPPPPPSIPKISYKYLPSSFEDSGCLLQGGGGEGESCRESWDC